MKLITRTVKWTQVTYHRFEYQDGKPVPGEAETATFFDTNDKFDPVKELKKKGIIEKDEIVFIANVEVTEDVYGVTLEDFMGMAKKVERPASQMKIV